MQEVVKRLQERQKPQESAKEPDYFWIAIAKAHSAMYPVMLPSSLYKVNAGDIVFFNPDGAAIEGEIVYATDFHKTDDVLWVALTVMTGREPLKVVRYFKQEVLKW